MAPNSPTYLGPGKYAYRDMSGNWRAGPKSTKYQSGQFVTEQYAKSVRGSIDFRNRVKGLQINPSEDTPDTYNESKSVIAKFNSLSDDLDEAEENNNQERIDEVEQEIDDLRADLGSP